MTSRRYRLGEELHDALNAAGGYTVITSAVNGERKVLVRTLKGIKLPADLLMRLKDFSSLLKEYVLERFGKDEVESNDVTTPSRFGSFRREK